MFELLSRTKYGQIGLDVGANSIRMLQFATVRERPFVVAAAARHLPEDAIGSDADPQKRRQLVVENAREMLEGGVFHARNVVSCVRADEIGVKNVRLPHMPDNELASAVVWECQERFGFEVASDRVHYIRAGEVRQGVETRDEVILMAVPDDTICRHLEMLSGMHLNPAHIDAEPTALFRAYQRFLRRADDESVVTVIVDIGLSCTKVIVARGRTILLIKTIDIAGRKFNESVAEELNMSYSEAASLRRRIFESGQADFVAGDDNDAPHRNSLTDRAKPTSEMEEKLEWSVFDAIREQIETLAREISLCLRYCSVTFRGLRPTTITLTGGEAYDQHLVNSLNEYLDCECVIGQPLWGIDLGGVEMGSDRRGELTEWSVAAGLALRGLQGKDKADIPGSTSAKFSAADRRNQVISGTNATLVGSGVSEQENR
ncbi:MAG: pilus assembly protein PilM [Phycisphaerae bacterium]|nr:pilus assembly protein PilM [Phycisphaerae bacterium]